MSLPKYHYCDDCDGTGWTEGGPTLQTACKPCGGHAILILDGSRYRSMTDGEAAAARVALATVADASDTTYL